MGLDMMALTTTETVTEAVDFDVEECELLHAWRKHPNLHGMMKSLYDEKGGKNIDFNCVNLALNHADLSRVEKAVRFGMLPQTAGFFFGESDGTEKAGDLAFIEKARTALNSNLVVFYRAWW